MALLSGSEHWFDQKSSNEPQASCQLSVVLITTSPIWLRTIKYIHAHNDDTQLFFRCLQPIFWCVHRARINPRFKPTKCHRNTVWKAALCKVSKFHFLLTKHRPNASMLLTVVLAVHIQPLKSGSAGTRWVATGKRICQNIQEGLPKLFVHGHRVRCRNMPDFVFQRTTKFKGGEYTRNSRLYSCGLNFSTL